MKVAQKLFEFCWRVAISAWILGSIIPSNLFAQELKKITLGLGVAKDFGFRIPAEVALDQGFWKREGLDVEVVSFRGGSEVVVAMASKSVDFGAITGVDAGNAISKKIPITAVSSIISPLTTMMVLVAPQSGIQSVQDLLGKSIGVTRHGALTDYLVRTLARQQGWDPKTGINILALGGFKEQVAALTTGQSQGFVWSADGGFQLVEEGKAKILLTFDTVIPDFNFEVLFAQNETIQNDPQLVQRFLRGWYRAVRYIKENKDYTIKMMMQKLELPETVAVRSYELQAPLLSPDGTWNLKGWEAVAVSLPDLGFSKTVPEPHTLYSSQFIPVKID
ncbi:MAG TPA: ABC transporter substrate-binding protein [Candidatus Limnocylindrales bacterium]|nr:ABC transporter substrate-binding protein [Candidatus Limnocylindrales bacterium]